MRFWFCQIWVVALLFVACGEDPPSGPMIWEIDLVDGPILIEPGSYASFNFRIDHSFMDNPGIVVAVTTTGETESTISVLLLSDANFELWKESSSYTSVFESFQTTGGNIERGIDTSGDYHLIFSNIDDADNQKTLDAVASVFYEQIAQ